MAICKSYWEKWDIKILLDQFGVTYRDLRNRIILSMTDKKPQLVKNLYFITFISNKAYNT